MVVPESKSIPCGRNGVKSQIHWRFQELAGFRSVGTPADGMLGRGKELGRGSGLTFFHTSAIIEICASPTPYSLRAPPSVFLPWEPSLDCRYFVCSSRLTLRGWLPERSRRNWESQPRRCLIIWKS